MGAALLLLIVLILSLGHSESSTSCSLLDEQPAERRAKIISSPDRQLLASLSSYAILYSKSDRVKPFGYLDLEPSKVEWRKGNLVVHSHNCAQFYLRLNKFDGKIHADAQQSWIFSPKDYRASFASCQVDMTLEWSNQTRYSCPERRIYACQPNTGDTGELAIAFVVFNSLDLQLSLDKDDTSAFSLPPSGC